MSADNVLDRLRLDGKVAVVTGSGRGIGRGIALGLADAGADVLITARRADDVEAVAAEVRERGRRAVAMPGDIHDFSEQLAAAAVEQLGRLDARAVGDVGGDRQRAALARHRGGAFGVTRRERDARPGLAERAGERLPEPAVAARHHRHLAVEPDRVEHRHCA